MANNLEISIITPSYNQCEFLTETIESVIGQEGDFHLDYIIVDGGSTDDSVEIIRHYENLLNEKIWSVKCHGINYRWLSEKDRGQTHALIKGFRLAKNEILTWINSDDVYLQGTLQAVAAFFRDNSGTALLYGNAHYSDPNGKIIGRYPTEEFDIGKLAYFNFICQPSAFFRKKAYDAIGGMDETLHYAMDYDLFVKIVKQFNCYYSPHFFSKYRLHETSKTMYNGDLFEYHEEILNLAFRHFGWAPLNRIYGSCYYYFLTRLPEFLTRLRILVIVSSLFCAILRSIRLNRGLQLKDLKVINWINFKKIFKERIAILRG